MLHGDRLYCSFGSLFILRMKNHAWVGVFMFYTIPIGEVLDSPGHTFFSVRSGFNFIADLIK